MSVRPTSARVHPTPSSTGRSLADQLPSTGSTRSERNILPDADGWGGEPRRPADVGDLGRAASRPVPPRSLGFVAQERYPALDLGRRLVARWERLPGEERLPRAVLDALVPTLPRVGWPSEVSSADVASYVAQVLGREGPVEASPIVGGHTAPYVFDVREGGSSLGVFKVCSSAEEMLTEVGALEELARLNLPELDLPRVLHAGCLEDGRAFLLMERAPGRVLLDEWRATAASSGADRSARLQALDGQLTLAAKALASLEAAPSAPPGDVRAQRERESTLVRSTWDEAKARLPEDVRQRIEARLDGFFARFLEAELGASHALGDAHPGNVALEGNRWSTFDAGRLYGSLGAAGEPLAPAANDAGYFVESIPYFAQRYGLTVEEGAHALETFADAYAEASGRSRAELEDDLGFRFSRVRLCLMDLLYAASPEAEASALQRLEAYTR